MDESIWKIIAGAAVIIVWWAIGRYFNKVDKRFDNVDHKLEAILKKQSDTDKKLIIHAYILKRLDPSFTDN